MVQKLLVIEKNTKEELIKHIENQLKLDLYYQVKSCSVRQALSGWEAWIIVDDHNENIAGLE